MHIPMPLINWTRVIQKTVNWSCWVLSITIFVDVLQVSVGSPLAEKLLGIALGLYMLCLIAATIMDGLMSDPKGQENMFDALAADWPKFVRKWRMRLRGKAA